MQGKIKFKLTKDFFFNKRVYKIFVNDNFVGELSNKNTDFDAVVDYGTQNVKIVGQKYQKEIKMKIGPASVIQPVYISHSQTFGVKLPKVLRGVLMSVGIFLFIVFIYNNIVKGEAHAYYIWFLAFLLVTLSRYNAKEFKVLKNRFSLS